jgi:hypothetical protein
MMSDEAKFGIFVITTAAILILAGIIATTIYNLHELDALHPTTQSATK